MEWSSKGVLRRGACAHFAVLFLTASNEIIISDQTLALLSPIKSLLFLSSRDEEIWPRLARSLHLEHPA
jgi:hypothetical protein